MATESSRSKRPAPNHGLRAEVRMARSWTEGAGMNLRTRVGSLAVGLILLLPTPSVSARGQGDSSVTASSHAVLSGRVLFQGPLPEAEWVPVRKHREFCGKERSLGRYRISPSKGVENTVVLLQREAEAPPIAGYKEAVAALNNRGCEFLPRVQVTRPHAVLEVRNSDPILHSAHAFQEDGRTAFHVALPHFRDRTRTRLPRSGLLRIVCDVGHTWMRAFILITSAPFTAVTGPEGTFEIRGIPPGRYRLTAWHEVFGEIQREVSVAEGEHLSHTLVFAAGNVK